jgi:phosphate transport system permease protein
VTNGPAFRPAKSTRFVERVIHILLLVCATVSVLTTAGIVFVLVGDAIPFFRNVSLREFLFGTSWSISTNPPAFGVLPLLWGTMFIAIGALMLAVPTGVATAIFMSEYAPGWLRQVLKPMLEILAGIPSVVFGYFALSFITPIVLNQWLGLDAPIYNVLSAAVVLAIMILPTIVSLCDDAFRAVPRGLRDGAYALAATRFEVSIRVVFPAALSGVVAASLLALARAVGETMAVTLAAGAEPKLHLNLLESVQTMTAFIVQVSKGDVPAGTVEYHSIYAVGLTLFLITFGINLIAQRTLARFKEAYE